MKSQSLSLLVAFVLIVSVTSITSSLAQANTHTPDKTVAAKAVASPVAQARVIAESKANLTVSSLSLKQPETLSLNEQTMTLGARVRRPPVRAVTYKHRCSTFALRRLDLKFTFNIFGRTDRPQKS